MNRLELSLTATLALLVTLLTPAATQAAPVRDPIVFVHGWNGDSWNWHDFRGRFTDDGFTHLYAWDYDHRLSNATIAGQLSDYIDQVLAETGADRVDIVTHSMGGLSSRYYLKNLGGTANVDDWVSIGGPNHGTYWAWGCYDTSCGEMRPGSHFLGALNAGDDTPGQVHYATFWSSCDEVIDPDSSVLLSGASNTWVGCVGHVSMLAHSGTYEGVRKAVS